MSWFVTMKSLLLILLCIFHLSDNDQVHRNKIWKTKWNAYYMGRRLTWLMQTIHRDAMQRHKALNNLRFMYEESPHYEMGYIMGEIIERYKKMITHVRRRMDWENLFIHDLIRRVQICQYLYLQIYNLQRMMHEIELKYKDKFEFQNIHSDVDMGEVAAQMAAEKLEMENLQLKKKRELRKLIRLRKKQAKIKNEWQKYENPIKEKGMWPIEYGWDIGTDWLYHTNPYGFKK